MDTTKLRLGEVVAGVSAVLLFIVMFFHWYGVKINTSAFGIKVTGVESPGFSAWKVYSYTDLLLLLLIILALGMVFLSATQRSTALPISLNVIVAGLGGIMTLIVLYRLINQPGPNDLVTVKFWAYVGLLLTAGVAVGAFLAMRDEGTSFGDAAQRVGGTAGGGSAPPSPPPQPARAPAGGEPGPPAQGPPPSQPPPSQPPPGGGAPPTG
jgi:hypothetical protein